MTVFVLGVIAVDEPLLQLGVAAYLHGRKLLKRRIKSEERRVVLAENLGSGDDLGEYVENYLVVHCGTCRDGGLLTKGTVLRRYCRNSN